MRAMKIRVNGHFLKLEEPKTLQDLITERIKNDNFLVAELNGDIIKQPRWNKTRLNDGDSLELVSLFGGG